MGCAPSGYSAGRLPTRCPSRLWNFGIYCTFARAAPGFPSLAHPPCVATGLGLCRGLARCTSSPVLVSFRHCFLSPLPSVRRGPIHSALTTIPLPFSLHPLRAVASCLRMGSSWVLRPWICITQAPSRAVSPGLTLGPTSHTITQCSTFCLTPALRRRLGRDYVMLAARNSLDFLPHAAAPVHQRFRFCLAFAHVSLRFCYGRASLCNTCFHSLLILMVFLSLACCILS